MCLALDIRLCKNEIKAIKFYCNNYWSGMEEINIGRKKISY